MLLVTVGISGSGKNHLKDNLSSKFDLINIEPDQLRQEILGDINNQEQGFRIFNIAKSRLNKVVNNKLAFFNATSLDWKRNIDFVLGLHKNPEIPVIFIFMEDSLNLELCKLRIKCDLEENKLRSNVPEDISDSQHKRYQKCRHNALFDTNLKLPDNWHIFLYKENFETLCDFIKDKDNGNNK